MSLKLAASSDDRSIAICEHLLPIVRENGTLESQVGSLRLITLTMGPWIFNHWTPFNDLIPGQASSPGYRHALTRQHTAADLPYGLDVWHGMKVFSVLWSDRGVFRIVSFIRGAWEDEAMAL